MSPESPSSLDFDLAVMMRGVGAENDAFDEVKKDGDRAGEAPAVDAEDLAGPIAVGSMT